MIDRLLSGSASSSMHRNSTPEPAMEIERVAYVDIRYTTCLAISGAASDVLESSGIREGACLCVSFFVLDAKT